MEIKETTVKKALLLLGVRASTIGFGLVTKTILHVLENRDESETFQSIHHAMYPNGEVTYAKFDITIRRAIDWCYLQEEPLFIKIFKNDRPMAKDFIFTIVSYLETRTKKQKEHSLDKQHLMDLISSLPADEQFGIRIIGSDFDGPIDPRELESCTLVVKYKK